MIITISDMWKNQQKMLDNDNQIKLSSLIGFLGRDDSPRINSGTRWAASRDPFGDAVCPRRVSDSVGGCAGRAGPRRTDRLLT